VAVATRSLCYLAHNQTLTPLGLPQGPRHEMLPRRVIPSAIFQQSFRQQSPESHSVSNLSKVNGSVDAIAEEMLHINVQRFRGGLESQAHRLWVSLNSRLESNKEEDC